MSSQLQLLFGSASGVMAIAAAVPYIYTTLTGTTRPERAAFIIWGFTSTISFLAYRADGAQESVWFAAADFIVAIVMLGLALRLGYGWVRGRDTLGLIAAIFGIVLWLVTDEPFLALLFSVSVDAVGSALVAVKAYEAPETEYLLSWVLYLAAAVLAICAVGSVDYTLLFYPVYAATSTMIIIGSIVAGRRRTK